MKKKKIGQITIKKIGKKFAVCISGTPEQLYPTMEKAEMMAYDLRKKHGRRCYYKKRKKKKK